VTAAPAEPVAAVAERMSQAAVGAVVVMDGDVLAGVFTEPPTVALASSLSSPGDWS